MPHRAFAMLGLFQRLPVQYSAIAEKITPMIWRSHSSFDILRYLTVKIAFHMIARLALVGQRFFIDYSLFFRIIIQFTNHAYFLPGG
jgi:hypothetical protein